MHQHPFVVFWLFFPPWNEACISTNRWFNLTPTHKKLWIKHLATFFGVRSSLPFTFFFFAVLLNYNATRDDRQAIHCSRHNLNVNRLRHPEDRGPWREGVSTSEWRSFIKLIRGAGRVGGGGRVNREESRKRETEMESRINREKGTDFSSFITGRRMRGMI